MATLLLILIYIAFISLGLPDALLGAGWPVMQPELNVPYGFAGIAQMLIAGGTIVSSLLSGSVIKRFGTGKVTAVSVGLTAVALLGYAAAPSFIWMLVFAIPLGLGAGAVDAGLNGYVANHYESRHMSWLHSFWGVGAMSGPLVLSVFLRSGNSWRSGYLAVGSFQVVLVLILIAAVPLWDKVKALKTDDTEHHSMSMLAAMKIRGVPSALLVFMFYCGIEASMGLWGGSFLYLVKGLDPARAAVWVSFFYGSITAGRFLTGFLTYRFSNNTMIGGGTLIIIAGVILMLLPLPLHLSLAGFLLTGFGCAPIFPCMIHETPVRFGSSNSQAVIGFQMASAYIGTTLLPPLFGFVSSFTGMVLLPVFILTYAVFMLANFLRVRAVKA
ncbi:MFS transporter [Spirochaeta dissipatitropha]